MVNRLLRSIGIVVLSTLCTGPALAAVCNVPSAPHPVIQDAVDDISCTEIVLAAQSFTETVIIDRSLELRGASSTTTIIEGYVLAEGASTQVVVEALKADASAPTVAGCYEYALWSRDGAQLSANGVVAVNGDGDACLLFGDGFESSDTTRWSVTIP